MGSRASPNQNPTATHRWSPESPPFRPGCQPPAPVAAPIARTTAPPNMETHVKNTREPTTTPTNQPVFPSDHVFVVQFHRRVRGQGVGEAGRVVHLHSGDTARFHTRHELLAFISRLLTPPPPPPPPGRPAPPP